MKKKLIILSACLLCITFLFVACKSNPSMDDIKATFESNGYTIETLPEEDAADAPAGHLDAFRATRFSTIVLIVKFDTKANAKAYHDGIDIEDYWTIWNGKSVNNEFVCLIKSSDENGIDTANNLFKGCFK